MIRILLRYGIIWSFLFGHSGPGPAFSSPHLGVFGFFCCAHSHLGQEDTGNSMHGAWSNAGARFTTQFPIVRSEKSKTCHHRCTKCIFSHKSSCRNQTTSRIAQVSWVFKFKSLGNRLQIIIITISHVQSPKPTDRHSNKPTHCVCIAMCPYSIRCTLVLHFCRFAPTFVRSNQTI